ncbi:MAG TPA: MBL fold metallo-hydrolase [Solirubrobacteraceae bacterium]|nr:MBL fold metallo-hydrolase [Solirubrobacteraceae bacterium]
MAVATQPEPVVLPLPGGSPGATVRVWPLRCGEVLMPPRAIDRPRGPLWQLRGIGMTTPRSPTRSSGARPARAASCRAIAASTTTSPFDWRTIDDAGPAARAHGAFERTVDLFGDGSVRLLSTPGHTLGHQSLLLALDGRELLLTADAAYTRRTIDEELVPIFFRDERLYVRSLAQLREHVQANPRAPVICGHDARRWPQLDTIYA